MPAPPAPDQPVHDAAFAMPTEPAAALDVTAPLATMPAAAPAADPVAPAAAEPAAAEPAADADPTGAWWAPGNALVLAIAGLAWQLLSYYAREQLPALEASGATLTNFDNVVSNLPLAGSMPLGPIVGVLLAGGALALTLAGSRKGLKEPVLQGAVAAIALVSLLLVVALPKLVG